MGIGCAVQGIGGAETLTVEVNSFVRSRYLGDAAAAVYLVRPDQVVAARWTTCSEAELRSAVTALWNGV